MTTKFKNPLKYTINGHVYVERLFMEYNIGQQFFITRGYET